MRKIKFRIKDALGYDTFIEMRVENGGVLFESQPTVPLSTPFDAESITQFIGYDEQGNEIYEGDEFADPFNGRIFKAESEVNAVADDGSHQKFIDKFYVLEAIELDVLFSAPNLSKAEFQKMVDELFAVQEWFKNKHQPTFNIFPAARNVTISGKFSKKSLGYLQQVLDEYEITDLVKRDGEQAEHFSKLVDMIEEN